MRIDALHRIKSGLIDPSKHLESWNIGDPCLSNWTGIICYNETLEDGYLHIEELYAFDTSLFSAAAAKHGTWGQSSTRSWSSVSFEDIAPDHTPKTYNDVVFRQNYSNITSTNLKNLTKVLGRIELARSMENLREGFGRRILRMALNLNFVPFLFQTFLI
ncbi:hypothetical protein ACLOJK_012281 [Asimina triloba]